MFNTDDLTAITQKEIIKEKYTYNEIQHINRTFPLEKNYDDFTEEKFPHGFVFYDFEVFKWDWLVVLIDPLEKTKTIIANDRNGLKTYFDNNCMKIWTGYNSTHYDVPIMKGIILGMNAKEVSDAIIVQEKAPWQINRHFNDIKVLSFDCFDDKNSLKVLEAFMGNNIEETEVPFDIQRPLTKKEIYQTIHYCTYDVEQTIEVFRRRIDEWNSVTNLIETFELPLDRVEKTKQQLCAEIMNCEKTEHDDEWDIVYVPTIKLDKYKYIQDWFIQASKNKDYSAKLETIVGGIPHQFGWGGVHGAPNKPIHKNGRLFHLDVTSFYPSLMIVYELLSRNSRTPEKYRQIYEYRIALKKAGKKKEQAPYKIVLNGFYGVSRQKGGLAYDPRNGNSICVNGQLLLVDLIEKLEVMGDHFQLIQSNTDGIIVWIDNEPKTERWLHHICDEWINRTKMGLGFDEWGGVDENGKPLYPFGIVQKDVNNYVGIFKNGEIERKGIYVKELSELDNDLPIVNKALVNYITKSIPIEETINSSNDMIDFQKIFRVKGDFVCGWHNGHEMTEKTYRVYASTDYSDTYLGRCRESGGTPNKFGNCPEHCFIYNKEVKGVPLSKKLDKKWYINLAKKRLEDFGYEFADKNALF